MKKRGVLVFILLALAVASFFYFQRSSLTHTSPNDATMTGSTDDTSLVKTPFPFQELTIPYLRSRSYQSSLGEKTLFQQKTNYTTFLTSYDSDGLNINALLAVPTTQKLEKGYPAVVFIHGYIPPQSYQTTQKYEDYVDYLARSGIVVLKIDLRGHGGSDGEASGAYYSGDYVIDTLNAYAALEDIDWVDAAKIGLWGHSMGGNVVLRAVAAKQTIPKAVIWAGAVYSYEDFLKYRISDASYSPPEDQAERSRKRAELFDTYGSIDFDSWFWRQVPATNYLDGLATKIQIHHAVNDGVVDIGYSRDLLPPLHASGVPTELFEYSTGGHNISGAVFGVAIQRSAEFLTMQ